MKKITAILLTAVLLLATAACDNNSGGNNSGNGNQGDSGGQGGGNSDTRNTRVGEVIEVGQLNWLVIAVQDGRALLLSESILEILPYHSDGGDITWEHSSLREFLNGSFYDTTFTEQEKARIHEIVNANPDNFYNTLGGNDTSDRIFLLSIDEVNEYMGEDAHTAVRDARDVGSMWWLRSPGLMSYAAAIVCEKGDVSIAGRDVSIAGCDVFQSLNGGVRPALWLNL
jgi:hypothetical protein